MEPKIEKTTHNDESQSSAAAEKIVDDLLIEIFLWLPMKSLIRFKSVSKQWQSLISDTGFGILRNPNPNPATGLILQGPTKNQLRPHQSAPYAYIVSLDENTTTSPQIRSLNKCCIDDDSWPYYYDVTTITRSCCNGLMLTCRTYKTHEYHPMRYEYYVCNPTTNKYSRLPQIPDEPNWMLPMCLAFDPSNSPHYKVVCTLTLGYNGNTFRYKFLVYSSETGSWTKPCAEPFEAAGVNFQRGAYWNGAMHWVNDTKSGKSIYFDPGEDRMSLEMMPTPPTTLRNNNPDYYFGESCGHLHYIADRQSLMMDVYELRSDYSEWFVRYTVDPYSYAYRQMPYLCAVVRGKSDDDSFAFLLVGGRLVHYNFLDKTRVSLCHIGGSLLEQCIENVSVYSPLQHSESLCSV